MRPIGFSTGALAKGDFARGIQLQVERTDIAAIELSALRDHELRPLIEALPRLEIDGFAYVSLHAPSRLGNLSEDVVIDLLSQIPSQWPIIVHPETILNPPRWHRFGPQLCLENMDNRKTTGRTVMEMRELFRVFPDASFCLDVGHARQIDPTMASALLMLSEFSERLMQLHISEVGPRGEHLRVRGLAAAAFRRLAHRVPTSCALIIESVISREEMDTELVAVSGLFDSPKAAGRTRSDPEAIALGKAVGRDCRGPSTA